MKGVIANCLKKMVEDKCGPTGWKTCLSRAGFTEDAFFLMTAEVPDHTIKHLFESACVELNTDRSRVFETFGEYWINNFATQMYQSYFQASPSSREFLLKLNEIHGRVAMNMPNSTPPWFHFSTDGNRLLMDYQSHRGMDDLFIGIAKGVAKCFQETIDVEPNGNGQFAISFT